MSISVYGVVASMVQRDTLLDQVTGDDEWFGLKPLLVNILHVCHQYDSPKWEAEFVSDAIVTLIGDWMVSGDVNQFDEDPGSGINWSKLLGYEAPGRVDPPEPVPVETGDPADNPSMEITLLVEEPAE